jgi:hypothetical protein
MECLDFCILDTLFKNLETKFVPLSERGKPRNPCIEYSIKNLNSMIFYMGMVSAHFVKWPMNIRRYLFMLWVISKSSDTDTKVIILNNCSGSCEIVPGKWPSSTLNTTENVKFDILPVVLLKIKSSRRFCHIYRWMVTDISKDHTAFIFMVK